MLNHLNCTEYCLPNVQEPQSGTPVDLSTSIQERREGRLIIDPWLWLVPSDRQHLLDIESSFSSSFSLFYIPTYFINDFWFSLLLAVDLFAMQFALPPRKNPPLPYAHSPPRISFQRKKQLKAVALLAFAALSVLFLLSHVFASATSSSATVPAGTSSVVIVTVLDREALSDSYIRKIVSNREDYAKRHGIFLPFSLLEST